MHDQQVSGATVATPQRMRRHSGANAECPATRRYRCDGDADHKAATPPAGAGALTYRHHSNTPNKRTFSVPPARWASALDTPSLSVPTMDSVGEPWILEADGSPAADAGALGWHWCGHALLTR